MEYFEQNIDAIRNEVKANRTHKQISDLFKCRFPKVRRKEVRKGFSERNVHYSVRRTELKKWRRQRSTLSFKIVYVRRVRQLAVFHLFSRSCAMSLAHIFSNYQPE